MGLVYNMPEFQAFSLKDKNSIDLKKRGTQVHPGPQLPPALRLNENIIEYISEATMLVVVLKDIEQSGLCAQSIIN